MGISNEVIEFVDEIVTTQIVEEKEIYGIFKEQMLQLLNEDGLKKTPSTTEYSEFGEEGNLLSYFVLAFVASAAKDLSKEGIKLTKVTLKEWISNNKKRINKKYESKILEQVLNILEKYLSK